MPELDGLRRCACCAKSLRAGHHAHVKADETTKSRGWSWGRGRICPPSHISPREAGQPRQGCATPHRGNPSPRRKSPSRLDDYFAGDLARRVVIAGGKRGQATPHQYACVSLGNNARLGMMTQRKTSFSKVWGYEYRQGIAFTSGAVYHPTCAKRSSPEPAHPRYHPHRARGVGYRLWIWEGHEGTERRRFRSTLAMNWKAIEIPGSQDG